MIATVENGDVTHVGPDRDHVTSQGHICVKGPAIQRITYDPDRLLTPLKRQEQAGDFMPVSWDAAIAEISERLVASTTKHGAGSFAAYIGNPAAFSTFYPAMAIGMAVMLQGKTYGPMHVDTAAKQLASELVYGSSRRWTFPDIERCDFLLMLGANPLVSHMSLVSEPLVRMKLDAIAERDGVIVIDPRKTETASRYEHVPIQVDSDAWLLAAMIKILIETDQINDEEILNRSVGWSEIRSSILALQLDEAAKMTGIEIRIMKQLATRFANANAAACYGRVGTNRGSFSTLCNVLIELLNFITGNFAREGGSVFGQPAFGELPAAPGSEYGAQKSRVSGLPLILGTSPTAELADDILVPGEGQLRTLFLHCGNPVLSIPDGPKLEKALEQLDLFVAFDLYQNETNKFADFIFPGTTFLERSDINELWATNAPRPWLQYSKPVIQPRGQARLEHDVLEDILAQAGLPSILSAMAGEKADNESPREAAIAALFTDRADGLTLNELKERYPHGYQVLENVDAAYTWQRIQYEDQKPRFWGELIASEFERLSQSIKTEQDDYLKLFGRRNLKGLNSWMHNDERLTRRYSTSLLMHPEDAKKRGLTTGDTAKVSSKSGEVIVPIEVTEDVIAGSICYPHGLGHAGGWRRANELGGVNINLLASAEPEDWEPVSGACLLDGIPVTVARV